MKTYPKVSIVVAVAENGGIGKDNQLLWHLPADLKHFKNITSGHSIIMGRKTYESIGKPLPNRRNMVITRNKSLYIEGVETFYDIKDAIEECSGEQEVFIIGGAEIYKQSIGICDQIYLTTVHQDFPADAFFPKLEGSNWKEISSEFHKADEKNKFDYTFSVWSRIA